LSARVMEKKTIAHLYLSCASLNESLSVTLESVKFAAGSAVTVA
jgi:hypothetical protein